MFTAVTSQRPRMEVKKCILVYSGIQYTLVAIGKDVTIYTGEQVTTTLQSFTLAEALRYWSDCIGV